MLLYFNMAMGDIKGARVKNYLLEKSRIVGPSGGERNYHVFYHILRGASDKLLQELGLTDTRTGKKMAYSDFTYLKQGTDID